LIEKNLQGTENNNTNIEPHLTVSLLCVSGRIGSSGLYCQKQIGLSRIFWQDPKLFKQEIEITFLSEFLFIGMS
jgi:hypothetical protein